MSNRYFIKTIGQTRKATDKSCRICKKRELGGLEAPCNACLDPINYREHFIIDPKIKAMLEASKGSNREPVKVKIASKGQVSQKGLKTTFVTITR